MPREGGRPLVDDSKLASTLFSVPRLRCFIRPALRSRLPRLARGESHVMGSRARALLQVLRQVPRFSIRSAFPSYGTLVAAPPCSTCGLQTKGSALLRGSAYWPDGTQATRKPLLRRDGSRPSRYADRQSSAVPPQPPPRNTRDEPGLSPTGSVTLPLG